jgi:DNA invertase Pin-like site-specific DNA recombinase
MAWSVDRLGRSLQDLVGFLSEIHALKVDLYLHQQGLDTTTPAGKAMFQMMGVFAEFERAMIQERVRAGLRRAKETGTKSGKPIGRPTIDAALEASIRDSLCPWRQLPGYGRELRCCSWHCAEDCSGVSPFRRRRGVKRR